MTNQIENCGNNRIIWRGSGEITMKDVGDFVKQFLTSEQFQYLQYIGKYYDSRNPELQAQYDRKRHANKTPNWLVPTAYFPTLVDSLSGYMYNDVKYVPDEDAKDISEPILDSFKKINRDILDMETGAHLLAFGKAYEIVYTIGNGTETPDIDCISVDPRQMFIIYDNAVRPNAIMGIRILVDPDDEEGKYLVDSITATRWDSYKINKEDEITINNNGKNEQLYWTECPCIEFNPEVINGNSAFHSIIPTIAAMDALVTGNQNEVDKLADAILTLSKKLDEKELENMQWLKVIDGMDKGDIVAYVQRQIDPTFREYLTRFLDNQIHKHSHVVDMYNPETGINGVASGKALKMRLLDMEMNAMRIEKNSKTGWAKMLRLFRSFFSVTMRIENKGDIDIVMNRVEIPDLETIAQMLEPVTFISKKTKQEYAGLDPVEEEKRLEEEKEKGTDITDMLNPLKESPTDVSVSDPTSSTTKESENKGVTI